MPDFDDFGREISKIWPKKLFRSLSVLKHFVGCFMFSIDWHRPVPISTRMATCVPE
jgi:hypothetical protein